MFELFGAFNSSPGDSNVGLKGDWIADTAYAYAGADFSDLMDRSDAEVREMIEKFASGEVTLSDIFGPTVPTDISDYREETRERMKELLGHEP